MLRQARSGMFKCSWSLLLMMIMPFAIVIVQLFRMYISLENSRRFSYPKTGRHDRLRLIRFRRLTQKRHGECENGKFKRLALARSGWLRRDFWLTRRIERGTLALLVVNAWRSAAQRSVAASCPRPGTSGWSADQGIGPQVEWNSKA